MVLIGKEIQLVSRPTGWPTASDFRMVAVEHGDLAPGEVLVANEFISVDPYMRGWMIDQPSYAPPYALGETMSGGAVGRVVQSTADELPVGTLVLHQLGWRDIARGPAWAFHPVSEPVAGLTSSIYLGILGLTGLTAYAGLLAVAQLKPGETVFISGAAGAVGTAAGQIARLKGAARVIGSAGSPEKVALLTEKYGFDAAINYRTAPIRQQLAEVASDGIDVYFDNVGGDHLEAALDVFNDGGRAALCGAIAGYNNTAPQPGPDNLYNITTRSLTLTGFIVGNYLDRAAEFNAEMAQWLASGEVVHSETVVDGIDNAVEAFIGVLSGANTGKMVIRTGS